jgi:peptide/nickel transport system permease protein
MDDSAAVDVGIAGAGELAGVVRGRLRTSVGRKVRREQRWSSLSLGAGIVIIAVLVVVAGFPSLFGFHDPNTPNFLVGLQSPSLRHLFGTDQLGRDILTRVVYAGRVDLAFAFVGTYAPLLIGVVVGAVVGYVGGAADVIAMRLVDVVLAFPLIVLVLAFVGVFGPGLAAPFVGVVIVGWSAYARLSRGEMLRLREQQFMLAAETLGFSRWRIILRHGVPNLITPSLVFSMSDMVLNILLLASLSYFGLGVQAPSPEWGELISFGQPYLQTNWWVGTMPGLVIVLAGAGFSLIGDGLADRLGQEFKLAV